MKNVIHALIWAIAILVTSFVMAQNGFEKSTTSTVVLMMVMAATATLITSKRSCAVCR
ncbi:MAG: hypothetical protein AAFY07_01735 [Pseudomonadota bacterium]